MLTGPGTAICRGSGRAGIETAYLALNLVLNVGLTISLVLLIGPIGTAVATGATWAVSSILFLFVLHARLDLPVDASRRAAATALLAAAVAWAVHWTSGVLGVPAQRWEALWYSAVLGAAGAAVYFGALLTFGLASIRGALVDLRALVGRPV
jgi:O-antigen/teichoic acid export membrane protein